MGNYIKYPIGEQDFKSLREMGCVYVDKTEYIDRLIHSGSKYYFLARPRRFGKSLFLSTLRYFFEGNRQLFKDLRIESSDWSWESYPVLYLDFNTGAFETGNGMDSLLESLFSDWEEKYKVEKKALSYSQRFRKIIEAAHKVTGRQVIILVDEYDKALVRNLRNKENFEHYKSGLAAIYSNFKSSAEHIRLVFLTGVSRFNKLSVFPDLNNLDDISFSNYYADLCGITERELIDNFKEGITEIAETNSISFDSVCRILKDNYDGYRFALNGSDIYNPWSVLKAMQDRRIDNYWNYTGKPTVVAEALKEVNADLEKLLDQYCPFSDLQGLDIMDINPTALLYQTGYLTIKGYIKETDEYFLSIPNREVKEGFFKELIPYYLKTKSFEGGSLINSIIRSFAIGNPDEAMRALQSYFAGIDYSLKIENENNFHNAFFLLTSLIGLKTKSEVHTSDGRIDIEIATDNYFYIIELKYDHPAEEALSKIERKKYNRKYHIGNRKIYLIGVEFSSKTRCIESWDIREG